MGGGGGGGGGFFGQSQPRPPPEPPSQVLDRMDQFAEGDHCKFLLLFTYDLDSTLLR